MITCKPIQDPSWHTLMNLLPPLNSEQGPWIAGGSARKLWLNEPWQSGDVDVFFTNEAQMRAWRTKLDQLLLPKKKTLSPVEDDLWLMDQITCAQTWFYCELDEPAHETQPYQAYVHMETDNAVTYHILDNINHEVFCKLQLIKVRHHEHVMDLWKDFDFTVCCFAADATHVWCNHTAAEHVQSRRLVLQSTKTPANLPLRTLKHMIYGFEPDAHLLQTIMNQIESGDVSWQPEY